MNNFFGFIGVAFCGIIFIIIISIILGFPIMLLWNWLIPTIFELPEIGILQAIGLNILSGLLLKSDNNKK